jgi:hypothetical protein
MMINRQYDGFTCRSSSFHRTISSRNVNHWRELRDCDSEGVSLLSGFLRVCSRGYKKRWVDFAA